MTDHPYASLPFDLQAIMGLNIAFLHIFDCLHADGVLSFSEAARSLKENAGDLDAAPEATRALLFDMVAALEKFAAGSEPRDPPKPPPRMHPDLRMIHGGRKI